MSNEAPYDPYIPAGGNAPQAGAQGQSGNHRTAALQAVRRHASPSDAHALGSLLTYPCL